MRRLLGFLLKAAVSGFLLYFAFRRVNFIPLGQRFDKIEYLWLVAAVFIFIAQTTLGALRWQTIVNQCNPPGLPSFAMPIALRYTFIAAFFNQTLPSTVGGDAVRIWQLARDQGNWRTATYSVLIDRLTGVLVLAFLVILCLPWSFALISDATGRTALVILGVGSVSACLVFFALGFVHWRWLDRLWVTRQLAAAASMARRVIGALSSGPLIIVYSLLIHALSATAAWGLAKAAAAPLDWIQALLLVLPVLLIATIPLSIAGWGTRESAMVLAFGYAGLPESDGLIVSVLLGVAMFAAGVLGGGVWILDRGKRNSEHLVSSQESRTSPPKKRRS